MMINFVGNFQAGYVGEQADQVHLAREMEALGHTVRRIPQDAWREYVIEGFPKNKYAVPEDLKADINIITKWHHFDDGSFISQLRIASEAPVFYWVWDYMEDSSMPGWHIEMVQAADLYLSNDIHNPLYKKSENAYYFPFDVADGELPRFQISEKKYDVSFFGSWISQGDRQAWLSEINKTNPIKVFSWNYKDWPKEFNAEPAVYGVEFNKKVAESKICLGFSVEPNCWGYWSNRTGKTLLAGGFLLQQYAPGMELFLREGVEYFSSIEEAREKIDHYLIADMERKEIAQRGLQIGQDKFSSKARVKELMILIERYLKKDRVWML